MEFVKKNIKVYLDNEWNTPQLQEDVAKLREASKKDAGPPIEETGPAGTVQESVARYVIACIDEQRGNDALFKFRFHMWFYGYDKNKLVTAVYTDVADSLAKWHAERIKVYVCSNSWKEVSKRFLAQTVHGNLTTFVDDYFDSSDGPLTKSETFNKIAERIQIKPPEIVFLTKSGDEARAALAAGWVAVLVLTHQREIDRMKEEDKKLMMIRTFTDLQFGENPPPVSAAAAASASSPTNKAESGGAGASGSAKSKVKSAGPRASQASSASKQKSMTVKSTSRKSAKEKSASLKSKKGGSLASSKASRNTSAAKSGSSKTKKSSRKSASSAASKSGQSSNAASASKSGSSAASSGASGSGASGTASGSSGTSSTNSFGSNAVASNPSGSTASGSGSNSASSGSSASGSSGASGTSDSAASGSGASSGSSGSSNTSGSGASGSASGSSSSK